MAESEKKKNNNCTEIIGSLLENIDGVLASKTVVGEPTKIDDTIIVPLVDVSFGVAAGATAGKKENGCKDGGAGGVFGKMSPNAVLVIKDGVTKLVNIKNQDTVEKLIDLVPTVIDKFNFKKGPELSKEEVKEAAFPSEGDDNK